jgi:hypothetical protein
MVRLKKSTNSSKITAKLAKRFAEILATLPDDELYQIAKTDDQRQKWEEQRGSCTIVGRCFLARFTTEDDPITHLLESSDPWHRLSYEHTWRLVDYHESLWGLTQMIWRYVKAALIQLEQKCPFENAWDFFIAMISECENTTYSHFLQCEYKPRDTPTEEKALTVASKAIRAKANPLKRDGLTPKERNLLKKVQLGSDTSANHWLAILVATAEVVSPSDAYIRDKYRAFLHTLSDNIDAFSKFCLDARKRRNGVEMVSEYWVDGTQYAKLQGKRSSP